jgi:hypothetical protein
MISARKNALFTGIHRGSAMRLVLICWLTAETSGFVASPWPSHTAVGKPASRIRIFLKPFGVGSSSQYAKKTRTRGRAITLASNSADDTSISQPPSTPGDGNIIAQPAEGNADVGIFSSLRVHPIFQMAGAVAIYCFHVFVLCKREFNLPLLLMDGKGEKMALSWELVFGTIALAVYFKVCGKKSQQEAWALANGRGLEKEELPSKVDPEEKKGMTDTIIFLGLAYLGSGYLGQACHFLLCLISAFDVPITLGMCTSLQVLLAHLAWVIAGTWIIQWRTANKFLSPGNKWFKLEFNMDHTCKLMWSIIGGYLLTSYISTFALSLSFVTSKLPILQNVVEMMKNIPESQTEQIVMRLKNPEGGGLAAQIVGCIGPCLTG